MLALTIIGFVVFALIAVVQGLLLHNRNEDCKKLEREVTTLWREWPHVVSTKQLIATRDAIEKALERADERLTREMRLREGEIKGLMKFVGAQLSGWKDCNGIVDVTLIPADECPYCGAKMRKGRKG